MPERSWVRIPATDTQLTIISHLLGVIVLMFEKTKSGSEWALYKTPLSLIHSHTLLYTILRSFSLSPTHRHYLSLLALSLSHAHTLSLYTHTLSSTYRLLSFSHTPILSTHLCTFSRSLPYTLFLFQKFVSVPPYLKYVSLFAYDCLVIYPNRLPFWLSFNEPFILLLFFIWSMFPYLRLTTVFFQSLQAKQRLCLSLSFSFIFGVFKQTSLQLLQQKTCKKMSIQYTVLGFEPMTFET